MSVSVDKIRNEVLLFSDFAWGGLGSLPTSTVRNITALSGDIAYSSSYSENITVLASRYAEASNRVIQGLLYVPDLKPNDPCNDMMKTWIPKSAVRQANLPPTNYNLIALFPWVDEACTKHFLDSARLDPIRAMIVYRLNHRQQPPSASSKAWNLDGTDRWRRSCLYPIFAVSGEMGGEMMKQLALYSGNITEVPFGANITDIYDPNPDAYVRIWTELSLSTSGKFPVWFLIIAIAGVVVAAVVGTSLCMHAFQSIRRASLRRRVVRGEVNLEGMGICRLTLPMHCVGKFPLFTYYCEEPTPRPPTSPTSPTTASSRPSGPRRDVWNAEDSITSTKDVPPPAYEKDLGSTQGQCSVATHHQPQCLICSKAFQNKVTVIRELSCGHIFHPDCIDDFLNKDSSLCPICKSCMFPKGYCPKITNSMTRRERAIRRLRNRSAHHVATDTSAPDTSPHEPVNRDTETGRDYTRAARMRELASSDLGGDGESGHTPWQKLRHQVFPGF